MKSLRDSWLFLFLLALVPYRAEAIPIFAQRYHLQCEACHSVLPELNSFGEYFRDRGYRLQLPRHGTTVVAIRYQLEWEKDPVNARRFTPGGVVLGNADVGRVAAFVHYNLGAQGGPSGTFLAYLATYDEHVHTLYRAGLFELPLLQSPGQRLDDLQQYGYYGAHAGLNDLPLSSPRWGLQVQRTAGILRFDGIMALGEFKGAAYGGAPAPTGETTSAAAPELGLFVRAPLAQTLDAGVEAISGSRSIVLTGKVAFRDAYMRDGAFARWYSGRFEATAEQWWGHDADVDGFGTPLSTSGGYLRAKYYPNPHAYLAARYDATANPVVARDIVYYGAFMITPHARFLLQNVHTIGSGSALGAAITVGAPWPAKL